MSNPQALQRLHQLLQALEKAESKLERGPKKIRRQRKVVEQKAAEIEAAKELVKKLKLSSDQKTLQMKTLEAKITDLRGKRNGAKSNVEFEKLNEQIDADSMALSVLEDEIIETLDKIEEAEQTVRVAEEAHKTATEEQRELANTVEERQPGLLAEKERLEAEIAEAEKDLPEKHKRDYRRLRENYGSETFAMMQSGACTNCNVNLSPQNRVEVKSGAFLFCKSCGRILYHVASE